jgi:hypothetical protein
MYTSLDIAYNDNSTELDKMAREINNKKSNLFKTVYNDFENKQQKWENDIIEYNNSYKTPYGYFNSHPDSDNSDKSNNSKKSDKSNNSNSSNNSYNSIYSYNSNSSNNSYVDSSIDSDYDFQSNIDSISIDSPSLDSYIENIKEKPHTKKSIHDFIKNLKHNKKDQYNNNKHNHNLNNNNDDIFTHIKYCFECREQLLKYMKKHNNEEKTFNNKNTESLFNYFGTIQLKEIILIIVLGIILMVILDFLMRTVQYQR